MALPVFPSLKITANALTPKGAFAEAQAAFLKPDPELVTRLNILLREKNVGVVAHFYMDPELQGVLSACDWPHIHVSDSLAMADRAIAMAEAGARGVWVPTFSHTRRATAHPDHLRVFEAAAEAGLARIAGIVAARPGHAVRRPRQGRASR